LIPFNLNQFYKKFLDCKNNAGIAYIQ